MRLRRSFELKLCFVAVFKTIFVLCNILFMYVLNSLYYIKKNSGT